MEFSEKVKTKCLLWCDRHCCLCKKPCGVDIEVAHIDATKTDSEDIDNAIPLCYDCHAKIGHYNQEHPRGNKYKENELKVRRNQIYEEHTRHLVPPIHFEITQNLPGGKVREFPDIGFSVQHLGDSLPVNVLVGTEIFLDSERLKKPTDGSGHYSMEVPWKMNPRLGALGHFDVHEAVGNDKQLRITIHAIVIDQYERRHELLPMSWAYIRESNSWYYDP